MPRTKITVAELTDDGNSYRGRELYAQEFDSLDVRAIIAVANGLQAQPRCLPGSAPLGHAAFDPAAAVRNQDGH